MTRDELIRRLPHHEGEDLEFKEVKGSAPKSAYKTVSAFANTRGGTIVFGIRDHGTTREPEIVGINDPNRVRDDFLNALQSRELGDHAKTPNVIDVDGKSLLAFRIDEAEAAQKPVCVGGNRDEAYLRKGSSDHRCSNREYDRLVLERERPRSGTARTEPDRYAAGSSRIQNLWRSTSVPTQPNGAMTWLRTVWVTGRPAGPPVLDEVQRSCDDLVTDLLDAAFRYFPGGEETQKKAYRENRHLRLVRGDSETLYPEEVVLEFRIFPDGAIVTSESVAGEAMEFGEPRNIDPWRLYRALVNAMRGVGEIWKIVDKSIVTEHPMFDIQLRNVSRRVLGKDTGRAPVRPFPIAPCPEDPVRVFDGPKVWPFSEGEAMRRLVDQVVSVIEEKFKSWGVRGEGHPHFGQRW